MRWAIKMFNVLRWWSIVSFANERLIPKAFCFCIVVRRMELCDSWSGDDERQRITINSKNEWYFKLSIPLAFSVSPVQLTDACEIVRCIRLLLASQAQRKSKLHHKRDNAQHKLLKGLRVRLCLCNLPKEKIIVAGVVGGAPTQPHASVWKTDEWTKNCQRNFPDKTNTDTLSALDCVGTFQGSR